MFEVIPAIDLKGGKCVQLRQGNAADVIFSTDEHPVEIARRWVSAGARTLHVIDLDGAFRGSVVHYQMIKQIADSVNAKIQVGGGIRSYESAAKILNIADKVILGTVAFKNPEIIRRVVEDFSEERVIVAIDARSGKVAVDGWQQTTDMHVRDAARFVEEETHAGCILFTNIDVEGLMKGIDADAIREVVSAVSIPVIASGGVSGIEDVLAAKKAGASGIVIGSAIYTRKIDLKNAIQRASSMI